MANYIHSTLSNDIDFPVYAETGPMSMNAVVRKIISIKGGANVRNRYSMATPTGMVTEVSDEDLAFLQKDAAFQRHVAKGFMKVMSTEKLNVGDMSPKDGCAQITDEDHASYSETTASAGKRDRWHGKKGVGFNE